MTLRHFVDIDGRHWSVWDVYASLLERRIRNIGPPRGISERRRLVRDTAYLTPLMARGWLAFERRDGERRRLAPIPSVGGFWFDASQEELCLWCEIAEVVLSVRGPDK